MAVTITVDELVQALRIGGTDEEVTELRRLRAYAVEAVDRLAPEAPDSVADQAVVQLTAYLFDQPTSWPSIRYASCVRNSGAGSILAPYQRRRAARV